MAGRRITALQSYSERPRPCAVDISVGVQRDLSFGARDPAIGARISYRRAHACLLFFSPADSMYLPLTFLTPPSRRIRRSVTRTVPALSPVSALISCGVIVPSG